MIMITHYLYLHAETLQVAQPRLQLLVVVAVQLLLHFVLELEPRVLLQGMQTTLQTLLDLYVYICDHNHTRSYSFLKR